LKEEENLKNISGKSLIGIPTLDEKLNISLDEEAILDVKTVGDLIKLVESNVQPN